jgi:hypothetical protein
LAFFTSTFGRWINFRPERTKTEPEKVQITSTYYWGVLIISLLSLNSYRSSMDGWFLAWWFQFLGLTFLLLNRGEVLRKSSISPNISSNLKPK